MGWCRSSVSRLELAVLPVFGVVVGSPGVSGLVLLVLWLVPRVGLVSFPLSMSISYPFQFNSVIITELLKFCCNFYRLYGVLL